MLIFFTLGSELLESSWPAVAKRLCLEGEVVYWELEK